MALATGAGCRAGYDTVASRTQDREAGGSAGSSGAAGDFGQAGEASGGTSSSGGTGASGGTNASGGAAGASSGGSPSGGAIGKGGASSGGASGSSTGGSSTSGVGGTSGSGGNSGTGGVGGSSGCSPTNGGVEICDGLDNDCAGGADDGVTCPATCRGVPYDGNGYMFCDAEIAATDADMSCTTLGMHLVKVDSAGENDFIASNMFATNPAFIWLGGDDIAAEGTWNWRDGELFWTGTSSGSAPSGVYTNWYPGYPGAGSQTDCLEMRDDGTWDDKQCSQGKRYACELLY